MFNAYALEVGDHVTFDDCFGFGAKTGEAPEQGCVLRVVRGMQNGYVQAVDPTGKRWTIRPEECRPVILAT